jgi:putative membrane protein
MQSKINWRTGASLAATGLLIAVGAWAQSGPMKPSDMKFAQEAAQGGQLEVQLGQLAVQNGHSDAVKQFGQRMVDDHSKANDKLMALAAKDNLTLPTQLDAQHQAIVDRFKNMSGAAFDKAYIQDMVKDHEEDIAAFRKEARMGSNPDLKSFATTTLPTLEDHLRLARQDDTKIMSMK